MESGAGGSTQGINITLTNGTAVPGTDGVGDTGGSGTDTFGASETFTNINAIRGGNNANVTDTVTGNDFYNFFEGLNGSDVFDGNGGSDRYSYNNEFRFGGSTVRGVVVNLTDDVVTVGGVDIDPHTGRDTYGPSGFVDTLLDVEEIFATNQDDIIYGGRSDNRFFLLNGDDNAFLGDGFDYVEPGAGDDFIDGQAGIGLDQSFADRDEVSYDDFGGNGIGVYIDLNSNTLVDPTGGIDTILDIERLRGTSSSDTLIGSDTANQREELYRGLGGNDVIDGRNGYDVADYAFAATGGIIANLSASAITVGAFTVEAGTVRKATGNVDALYYIEGIRGTNFDDTFVGNGGNNQFRGMGGDDTFDGGDGLDQLEMYFGDIFTGLGGVVNFSANPFTFQGETVAANSARQFDGGVVTMTSVEVVSGSYTTDGINGSEERDQINGLLGDDTIFGNGGNDGINGHQGANVLDGGDGFDTVSFMYDRTQGDYLFENFPGNGFVLWGGVTVDLANETAIGFDGLTSSITNFEAVTGTFVDDNITGDGQDNMFRGLSGDDTIDGGGGNDTINYSPTNQDGRILVPILGINYSEPNGVRVNLTGAAINLGGTMVAGGTALDGEGGTDTLTSIENVIGSIGMDFIAVNSAANFIDTGNGDDVVTFEGVETDYTFTEVNGGWQVARNDTPADVDILRNVESVSFTGGGVRILPPVALTETGDAQANEIAGGQGGDALDGGGGGDFVDGGEGSDQITGGTGNDELIGGDGDDIVDGGADNDTIVGGSGLGDDTYIGGDGVDTAVYTSASLGIVVDLDVPDNLGTGAGTATGPEIGIDQLTGIENVTGGQGDDSITGDGLDNNLRGAAGADQLFGEDGIDSLQGGSGNDILQGGADNDSLYGDSDDDTLKGGLGDDLLDGGANSLTGGDTADFSDATGAVVATLGADGDAAVTAAGVGTDTLVRIENLTGGSFGDVLTGNASVNLLRGGGGADTLDGAAGADILEGGLGDDRYRVTDGDDTVNEQVNEGTDTVAAYVDHTLAANVENLVLEAGATASGNALANRIDGHGGNSTLNGAGGNDLIFGYGGQDVLNGGEGNDTLDGGAGADTMAGGANDDRYVVDHASDAANENAGEGLDTVQAFLSYTLSAHVENLILEGGETATGNAQNNRIDGHGGNSSLSGAAGDDFLLGYGGDDIIDGGLNADAMVGGTGDDRYILDNGQDVVVENAGEGLDTIIAFLDHTIEDHAENMVMEGGNFGTGNALANRLDGHGGNNFLNGRGGQDLLIGYGGTDTLTGGDDDDTFVFAQGSGNDTITDMLGGVSRGDVIDIRDFGFANFEAVLAATTDVSGGALIQLDADDTVFVQNMFKAQFDSNDFLLA